MKQYARSIVVWVLGIQVRRLRKKNDLTIVGVVGSIGKTSTKLAIAQTLGATRTVRYQTGNYNDIVSVPLVFFGLDLPSLLNPFAWLKVFIKTERVIGSDYPYEIVVVELGTDGPGQIAAFKRYLMLDIAVVTSIAPEHMEYFKDIDEVAKEELSVIQYAKSVVINSDLIAHEYRSLIPEAVTYAIDDPADFKIEAPVFSNEGTSFSVAKEGVELFEATHHSFAKAQLYSLLASATVGNLLGFDGQSLNEGYRKVEQVSGRLQRLKGVLGSTIIDDSYNASPEATTAALEMIYAIDAPQKIALLGNMNELGAFSQAAHQEVGALCDPNELDEVVTLGPDANMHLATAAEAQGCKVTRTNSPYEAGKYIRGIIKQNAVVLVKGSQNNVFAEEAIKSLLEDEADVAKLVRQSKSWLAIKSRNFKSS